MIKIDIFIIDDNEDLLTALKSLLEANGIENISVFSKPDDLMKAMHEDVHICIVDYQLHADVNGLELIKNIVRVNKYCWFIMLSGQSERSVVIDYLNSVYGSRYVEKGLMDTNDKIISYVNEISDHIQFVANIYALMDRTKQKLNDLKNIIKGDAS